MKAISELCKFYDRLRNDPQSGLSDTGYQERLLYYKIQINDLGEFCGIVALTHDSGGKLLPGMSYMCPIDTPRGSNIAANIGYDKPEYLFGVDADGCKKPKHLTAWVETLKQCGGDDGVADACIRFYEKFDENFKKLRSSPLYGEYIKNVLHPWATFELIRDNSLLILAPGVKKMAEEAAFGGEPDGVCMVTGERAKIAETHPSFNLGGARPSLVAINQKKGFDSPGGIQGFNSPMSKKVAYEYTQAIKYLLSRQERHIGFENVVFIYWAESPCALETSLKRLLISQLGNKQDLAQDVRECCGEGGERDIKFHILGMTPNQRRVIIRTYIETTVGEIHDNVMRFFHERALGAVTPSVIATLKYFAPMGELSKIAAGTLTRFLEGVLLGGDFALGGLSQINTTTPSLAVYGCREKLPATFPNLPSIAMCAIKLILNRNYKKGYTMQLDEENNNAGYLCGRLFAAYVKAYEEVCPDSRYFDALMVTANLRPADAIMSANAAVESCIKSLAAPRRVQFQKLFQELHGRIGLVPRNLSDVDACAFLLGYYHQRDEFFKKHEQQ